jgi:hypothetical protein
VGSRRLAGWQTLIRLLASLPEDQRIEAWENLWQSLGDVETRQMLAEMLGDGWRWPPSAIRTAQPQRKES